MNGTVKRVDNKNQQQKTDLKQLFVEYSVMSEASMDDNIVDRLFELPYFIGFILYIDDKPAGFAVCYDGFSTHRCKHVLNIHDFMVSTHFQGCGHGKELLCGVLDFCRKHDYLKITLEVDDDNFAAQKLYHSCGFEDYQVILKGLLHWQKYLHE